MRNPPQELVNGWVAHFLNRHSERENQQSQEDFRDKVAELLLTGFIAYDKEEFGRWHPFFIETLNLSAYIGMYKDPEHPDDFEHWNHRVAINHLKQIQNQNSLAKDTGPQPPSIFEYFLMYANGPLVNDLAGSLNRSLKIYPKIKDKKDRLSEIKDLEIEIPTQGNIRRQFRRSSLFHISLDGVLRDLGTQPDQASRSARSRAITEKFLHEITNWEVSPNSNELKNLYPDEDFRERIQQIRRSFSSYSVLHVASTHALFQIRDLEKAKLKTELENCCEFFSSLFSYTLGSDEMEVMVSDATNQDAEIEPHKSKLSNPENKINYQARDNSQRAAHAHAQVKTRPIKDDVSYLVYIDGIGFKNQCWRNNEPRWKGFIRSSKITPLMDSAFNKINAEFDSLQPQIIQQGGDEIAVIVRGNPCEWVGDILKQNHQEFSYLTNSRWPEEDGLSDPKASEISSIYEPFWWWAVEPLNGDSNDDIIGHAHNLLGKIPVGNAKEERRNILSKSFRNSLRIRITQPEG